MNCFRRGCGTYGTLTTDTKLIFRDQSLVTITTNSTQNNVLIRKQINTVTI